MRKNFNTLKIYNFMALKVKAVERLLKFDKESAGKYLFCKFISKKKRAEGWLVRFFFVPSQAKNENMTMKYQPLTRFALATVAIVVLLAMVPTSCKQNPAEASADSSGVVRKDSADSAHWAQVCYDLDVKAVTYLNANQTDSLEQFVPGALKICKEHEEWYRYDEIWNWLISAYVWSSQYDKGVAEAKRLQDDALERNDSTGISFSYQLLGAAYLNMGNYEEGEKNMKKAIDVYPPHSKIISTLMAMYRLYCEALLNMEKYEQLDSALKEWRPILDNYAKGSAPGKVDVPNSYFYFHTECCKYYRRISDFKAASLHLDSAEVFCKEARDEPMNRLLIYTERFNLAKATHNYQEAFRISQKQMKLAKEAGDMSNVVVAMQDIVLALEGVGRYKEAYQELQKFKQLTDSLAAEDSREQLNELNKRFEVNELKMQAEREKMELERDKLQAERDKMQAERSQLYLVIAIILLALIGGALFAYYRYRSAKRMAKMRAAQERIENELQIARDIQMSMVPSTFPDYEGLDMYASMTPAKEVGGDLYGYVIHGSWLYFAVGDVSGKGVPASLFMAQATRLFRTMAHQGMEPAAICTRMNKELAGDDNVNGMFVTMFIGKLDLETGHLSFCNAGHNPPVLGGGDNKGDFLEMIPNAPIGLWPELDYEGEEIDTTKGRALFIYTDGLNEAENTAQEQFGDDRLLEILRNTHFDSARQVIETLEAEVEKHRNGAEPNDDLTMMGIYLRS